MWSRKRKKVDYGDILREFEDKLTKYFSEEVYSDTYIHECFAPAIDVFEKLLEEGVKKNEKI